MLALNDHKIPGIMNDNDHKSSESIGIGVPIKGTINPDARWLGACGAARNLDATTLTLTKKSAI